MEKKRLLLFGYSDTASPRYWTIRGTMEKEGWDIVECQTQVKGFPRKCIDLVRKFRGAGQADAVLVTFPGHYLMPLAWLLTRFPRRTLGFDAFLSLHDSLVADRALYAPWNPFAWFLFCMDSLSCHLADEVIVDTEAQRRFFIRRFRLKPRRVRVVYLETRPDLFAPRDVHVQNDLFEVFFYGTFIPLQGIEHILDAAAILGKSHPEIHFTLVGGGQTEPAMRQRATELALTNVTFRPCVPLTELPDLIHASDLCLGIFGTTDKAKRVIPHKVYDAVACGVPVLTARTPAILEQFHDGESVILCEAGNPKDIAGKILLCAQT
ncbi:MAG: glycosyltransferase [Candidatus Peribacteraceae bacterium]|nr:glycosyltransferase [Candidatus Peribacteraceae bacterium]